MEKEILFSFSMGNFLQIKSYVEAQHIKQIKSEGLVKAEVKMVPWGSPSLLLISGVSRGQPGVPWTVFSDYMTKTAIELMKWEHKIGPKLNLSVLSPVVSLWFMALARARNLRLCFLNSTIPLSFISSTPSASFKPVDGDNHLFNVGATITVSSLASCFVYLSFLNP